MTIKKLKQTKPKFGRRHTDPITKTDRAKATGAIGAIIAGWLAFLYFMQEILRSHTDWSSLQTPAAAAEIIGAIISSTVAFVGAWLGDRTKITAILKGVR